ncbi:MAG TPA: GNAT family N-acetyltransferase, partial [Methylomirabilota bacterium]
MLGPILEGERVRLEPPRPEYLPAYLRWFSDMEVTRYLLYRFPFTAKAEEEWLEQVGKDPHQVIWSIVVRHNGKLIGNTNIEKIDWRNRRGETGIVIGEKDEWGKGYAAETMR